MMEFRRIKWLLITASVASIAGCGQRDSVNGTVTYNGEPVEVGSVTFESSDGSGPGFGAQVRNGQYNADKVKLGKHIAHVRGLTKAPTLTHEDQLKMREQRNNKYGLPVDYIPEDAEGNSKPVDIEGGRQTLDFTIKGPPRNG